MLYPGIGSVIKQSIPEELEGDDITDDPNEVRKYFADQSWKLKNGGYQD